MAALRRGLALIEAAVSYTVAGAALVTPGALAWSTPCARWNVETLLDHVGDSMAVLGEAIATARIGYPAVAGGVFDVPGTNRLPSTGRWGITCRPARRDPVSRLRYQAAELLRTCAGAAPRDRQVAVGDRHLPASTVALSSALELSVHGWDLHAACGASRPIPPVLAAILLPLAPLLITDQTRPGLFADPVRVPGSAGPGDRLVAFLGRHPYRGVAGPPGV